MTSGLGCVSWLDTAQAQISPGVIHVLRVADPRSGARLCESQHVRNLQALQFNPNATCLAKLLRFADPRSEHAREHPIITGCHSSEI